MSDDTRPNSTESRLAVLEEQVRAFGLRLTAVSDRSYALTGSMQGVQSSLEEARAQRTGLIDKLTEVQDTINSLNTASVKSVIEMTHHVRMCESRSARMEKLAWAVGAVLTAVLGFLLTPYFARLTH